MATRDDHVITVSYPDGTTVVEHADGTRITVYYRESAQGGEGSECEYMCECILYRYTQTHTLILFLCQFVLYF